jgi:hypothetical protein
MCADCFRNDALRWYCVNLAYYKFQRDWNRGLYRGWQTIVILSTASVPIIVALGVGPRWIDAIPVAITAVGLAFITLFGWRADYVRFTRTVAELRLEAQKWRAGLADCKANPEKDGKFVCEINRIIKREVEVWQPERELEKLEQRLKELLQDS